MGLFSGLVQAQVRSRCSRSCISPKNDVVKILGLFDFAKVPGSEKYKNRLFLPTELKHK
jgi:hypothetical protein